MSDINMADLSAVSIQPDYFARLVEALIDLVNRRRGDHDLQALAVDTYIAHYSPDDNLAEDSPEMRTLVAVAQASAVRLRALSAMVEQGHLGKWRDADGKIDIRHPAVIAAACRVPVTLRGSSPEFQPLAFNFQADTIAQTMGKM